MWLRALLVAVTAYWIASLTISRAVLFVDAWRDAERVQRDESWLRVQCSNATFYANMRMHTNVCETVRRNAARSPALFALEAVARQGEILDPFVLWPLLLVPVAIHTLSWCVNRITRKHLIPI
jgi:hypothetical protein